MNVRKKEEQERIAEKGTEEKRASRMATRSKAETEK